METIRELSNHLRTRLADMKAARDSGRKVAGYTPGGYFPVELVIAAGEIPVGLIRGGDHTPVELSGAYVCRWIDTFARAQIGYGISGQDPYYGALDLLVVPITDNHMRAVSDVLAYNTELDIFTFGVPHMKEPAALEYYLDGIKRLRKRLEELSGSPISDDSLRQAIDLCNRERKLLHEISLTRRSAEIPLTSGDFALLNHGAQLADKKFMISILESSKREIKENPARLSGPRILLTGSTLAFGDTKLLEMIEESGGAVVVEEFAEGIIPYWHTVPDTDDPMQAIADTYFTKRVPPAWFRPGTERRDFIIQLAHDYNVDGIIWYQLMYRESYKTESYYFPGQIKAATGVPTLIVESDYDPVESAQMRTRIETFIQTLGG
jgi:benzoyl-CoA reductase/2-hydroxyglutaryl-CoA dehydratase subunit BcrC/BadD/HgdB